MKLLVQNINGLRSSHAKGLFSWLNDIDADIICLQEIRINETQLTDLLQDEILDYYHCEWNHATRPGYAGTATLSRITPLKITRAIGIQDIDPQGRVIISEYDAYFLINVYIPNGGPRNLKVASKIAYLTRLIEVISELYQQKEVIVCGDFNIAHHEIDLAQPKQNKNKSGFLLEERILLDQLISMGFVDVCRMFYPEDIIYSRYSYRAKNNGLTIGWRFDYVFVSEGLVDKVKSFDLPIYLEHSDHCPMIMEIDL